MVGDGSVSIILFWSLLLLLQDPCSCHSLCTDSRAPLTPKTPLVFCLCNGIVCCDPIEDLQLRRQFEAMNISDSTCAAFLKSIICSKCDQFSAELFKIDSETRSVLVLCNSTISANSIMSLNVTDDYCGNVWDACQNISIWNSTLPPLFHGIAEATVYSTSAKLTDIWQSKIAFCDKSNGSSVNGGICFNGEPYSLRKTEIQEPPKGLCLEKIANLSFLDMAAHPDRSNRVFLVNQQGQIWLANVPEEGSGKTMDVDESNPFLDFTDNVHFDTELGLMGIAFHPNFANNGRFFISYNCDKAEWPDCSGRCSCNMDVNCDPSKIGSQNGAMPCQYHSVISEFTANGTTLQPSLASKVNPSEVRRIFTMGLPYMGDHGGQILFGPADGYLYFMMGDGGGGGDPYNFAQNKKSPLGKIMRLDVDNIPSAKQITDLGLWGNYSIPKDNPYFEDKEMLPEIWALGFRNPWRCSFDSERPSYFFCGDSGQNDYEEVDIVTKGGNYGWRVYEGTGIFNPPNSPGGNTSLSSIKPIFPVMGYNHSIVNSDVGSASITGGYFYRSKTDPCMYGRYLYTDLYAGAIWAGIEIPENSGNFSTSQIPFDCAHNSPLQCSSVMGSPLPTLGYIFSMGQDNRKDIFILANKGVYRVARPSQCSYTCSKEIVTAATPSPSPSSGNRLKGSRKIPLLLSSFLLFISCIHLVCKILS